MYKKCVTKQAQTRQRAIEKGLLNMLLTVPFDDITIIDLCESLNIPRKAFYRYFSSKDGAMYALIDHTLLDFLDEFAMLKKDELSVKRITLAFFTYWHTNRRLLDVLAYNNLSGMLLQRAIDLVMEDPSLIEIIFPDLPPEYGSYTSIYFVSGVFSLIIQWHRDKFVKSPEHMTTIALSAIPDVMTSITRIKH